MASVEFTHRICERCWFDDENMSGMPGGQIRMPVQVKTEQPEPGVCCACGGVCITQIYFRRHQEGVLCQGRHGDDQLHEWAKAAPQPKWERT